MRAYRLIMSATGKPVSELHFLDRSDANRYQKILLWPWLVVGYFQSDDGQKFPLEGLLFRVDTVSVPGVYTEELDGVVSRQGGTLGYTPVVPGRCFNPSSWRSFKDLDREDPILAPKIAHAERELDASKGP